MRIYLTNLGCKLNQAELEKLGRKFLAAGHEVVQRLEDADVQVVNTCTVTHGAARTSRKVARRGRRRNPSLKTVLTGCYVNEDPERAANLNAVDLVVPNQRKDELVDAVEEAFGSGVSAPALPIPYVPLSFGNTRGLVKVEDGCNMRCSFCIIPFTRGRQQSRPLEDCVAEVRALAEGGYREVVVTGVQISSYRSDGDRLFDLVEAMLKETPVERLRLTSIAPWQLDRRLLGLFENRRLCRHFHFSLQSGSSETLRRMRRPYSAEQYRDLVEEVRGEIPGVAITTDVIVGFPGETSAEFEESLEFVEEMSFAKAHIFPYSSRPGTAASELPDPVDVPLIKERMGRMLAVAKQGEEQFWAAQLGSLEPVLFEASKGGIWQGLTDNYVRVYAESEDSLFNRLLPARLTALTEGGVRGTAMVA